MTTAPVKTDVAPTVLRVVAAQRERGSAAGFRPDIEGMRAIAVGLVVLGHAGVPFLRGGYVGVDIFFVISGFLITSILLRELKSTGRISLIKFYARRAIRLLPMATLVTIATLLASWAWLAPTRFDAIVGDAWSAAVYLVNYRLARKGIEYLNADEVPSPFQHYWSLAVEEQFYLCWPLLLLAVALILRRRRLTVTRGLAVALAGIVVVTFATSVVLTESDPVWSYFGLHTRGWELAIGALAAVGAAKFRRMSHAFAAALMWGGLAAIAWSAFVYNEATIFPGAAAAVPVLGAAAVIVGGCAAPRRGAGSLLGARPMQVVGGHSYGLYLWHWPVLMILPEAVGMEPTLMLNLVLIVFAYGLTALTQILIENPVRFAPMFKRRPLHGVGLGIGLTAVSVVSAFAAGALLMPQSVDGTGERVEPPTVGTVDELKAVIDTSVDTDGTPSNITPDPIAAQDDLPDVYGDGCHASFTAIEVKECVFGAEGSATRVVLFGDSHAASWFPALQRLAQKNDWELHSMTKSACPAAMIVKDSPKGGEYTECPQWRENALERIEDLQPDLVVVASSEFNTPLVDEGEDSDDAWLDGWRATLERLQMLDARVVMPSNPPWFAERVPDCVSSNLEDPSACAGSPDDLILRAEREQQVLALADSVGVRAVDVRDWFCTEEVCPPIIGNMLVYRDSHHFTTTYSTFLATVLASELRGGSR